MTPTAYHAGLIWAVLLLGAASAEQPDEHFEKHVRPLLIERCWKCHGPSEAKAGLRLDNRNSVLRGGDSGGAVSIEAPDDSLLLRAVRHQDGLKMPPDGKVTAAQIDALRKWIVDGAVWPGSASAPTGSAGQLADAVLPKLPNDAALAASLQLWLRADVLQLGDGDSLYVWPDQSGHGRDVTATKGVREGGVGGPGNFVMSSRLMGRPAVRFSAWTGLASSPGNPVDIRGDAALTMMIVMNLQHFEAEPSHATVLSIGNPAHNGDPGKPLAALIEIDKPNQFSLDLAGGWGHDATAGTASFQNSFGKPIVVSIVKQPGSMRDSTRIFINGQPMATPGDQTPTGSQAVPDIQHRSDVGVMLGKALAFCGPIQGDIGEVLLYNAALADSDRLAVETYLGEKHGLWIAPERTVAPPATYTEFEKGHWAYQPIKTVPLPAVNQPGWVRTPIDAFTLSAFAAAGRSPAADSDRLTWLRRVTFDLTGLPPTPEEVDSFVNDLESSAYEKVVERLLQSPHYGERWARHWLDVVRYAESTANDANAVMRYAWRYRNYVIDAFNHDLPYNQFVIEQLAGDLLPKAESPAEHARQVIATGFLMVGPKALAETDKEQSRLDIVDDQIDVTGRAMLGLTLACARCHDHKFDAIRATDYYALAGIFRSTEPFQDEVRNATMWWEFPVNPESAGAEPVVVMAPKEAQPRNLRVHLRGNRFTLGKIVPRGTLGVVNFQPHPNTTSSFTVDPNQSTSGRLELARWIASDANPLSARVMVNRVWHHHFGQGIVATTDNLGTRGSLPTQPELLDYLAGSFIQNKWSIKQLQRMIVLSSTYRMQNSQTTIDKEPNADQSALAALQFHRRRLSAEEIRDAMLAISGQLDRAAGSNESGEFLFSTAEDIKSKIRPNRVGADDEFYSTFRKRSIYLPIVRNMLPDVLALFDAADPNGVTAVRNETTVASQSLFLLNHPFVRGQARALAERLLADAAVTDSARIQLVHRLAFARGATDEEINEALAFLAVTDSANTASSKDSQPAHLERWQAYCQTLLCSNEFLYVE